MRVHFRGEGLGIPPYALPDPGEDSNVPVLVRVLQDGVPFVPDQYIAMGYDRYEVWVVGAAGGRGGAPANVDVRWQYYLEQPVTNPANIHYFDPQAVVIGTTYDEWTGTDIALLQRGGGGGGGGLHVVSGLLAALPDEVPVVVGQAGADAPVGLLRPNAESWEALPPGWGRPNVFRDPPYVTFHPPQAGGNGGYSSFGTVAQASGGKGGHPAVYHVTTPGDMWYFDGAGGEGGLGGRTAPGGGAPGSSTTTSDGADGTWDGIIGSGGGGGRGGGAYNDIQDGRIFGGDWHPSTNGGQGAFSYLDPSILGTRGLRAADPTGNGKVTMAGVGGGVRANRNLPVGSYAPGYSPNGAVLIRLSRAA